MMRSIRTGAHSTLLAWTLAGLGLALAMPGAHAARSGGSQAAREDAAVIRIKPMGKAPPLNSPAAFCAEMVRRLPNVSAALCKQADLSPIGVKSVNGQPLYLRDVVSPHARLRVLVVGGIHGDELSATALALHWIRLAEIGRAHV